MIMSDLERCRGGQGICQS